MPFFVVGAGLVHPRCALCHRWTSSKEERTKAGYKPVSISRTRVTRVCRIGVWDLMRCVARRLQNVFVSPVQSDLGHGKGPLGEHASYMTDEVRLRVDLSPSMHGEL